MAHIACITTGLTGMLNASFELVARLQKAGHQVTYLCPWEVESAVKAQGFAYIQLPKVNFNPGPKPTSKLEKYWKSPSKFSKDIQKGISNLNMEPYTQVLLDLNPDLVILDMELHEHIMTTYGLNIPMVLLSQWFSVWKRPNLPPSRY